MSIYIRKAKDGFVIGSYKYNQNMCSLDCIHMLVFCFNQYAIHWHCSGQSENWNWHKNLCFNYNVSTRDVLNITHRKMKQHQRIRRSIVYIYCVRTYKMHGIPSLTRFSKLSGRLKAQPKNINFTYPKNLSQPLY